MIKNNNVYCLDCIKGLQSIIPKSIDMVFADPPFNIGYKYDKYIDNRKDYVEWCGIWISLCKKILKNSGTFWLAIGDEYVAELKILTENIGFFLRNWVIWYYTFGVQCKRKFARSHTHLLYFVCSRNHFTFNADSIRIPSARQLKYNDKRANLKGKIPDNTWIISPRDYNIFMNNEDTWECSRIAGTFKERTKHPCQMPEKILERVILATTNQNDVVLDPFAGSGTTLAVAKKLNRQYIGFEISENYIQIIKERLDAEQ